MAISPKERDCQCLPDVIADPGLLQTYLAQAGLGDGGGEEHEEERVLQCFSLVYC